MRGVMRSYCVGAVQKNCPVIVTADRCLAGPTSHSFVSHHSCRSMCTHNPLHTRTPRHSCYCHRRHHLDLLCTHPISIAPQAAQQRSYCSSHTPLRLSTQQQQYQQQQQQQHHHHHRNSQTSYPNVSPLQTSCSRASHVTLRGPLKDRYPPMAVDLDDPRRRLAVLIDGSAHTRLLQPVDRGLTHTRGNSGNDNALDNKIPISRCSSSASSSSLMTHYGAFFTHVLPALYEFGVPVLLRVFAYELTPEWAPLIAGSTTEDGERGSHTAGSSSRRYTDVGSESGSESEPCGAASAGSVKTQQSQQRPHGEYGDRRPVQHRPNSMIVRGVLTLPAPPAGKMTQSSDKCNSQRTANNSINDDDDYSDENVRVIATDAQNAYKDNARPEPRRVRGVDAMVEVEYFRVERFIPIPMQMEADAQHIHDFRAQNKVEGVCYVCSETDRAVYERVMAQQQQDGQLAATASELSVLRESLQGRFRDLGSDSSAVFFNQYLFDELGLVKEINVDRRPGNGR